MFGKQVCTCRQKIHPLPIPFTSKSPGESFILSLKPAELMEFTASTAVVQLPSSCFALIHTTQIVIAWCIFFFSLHQMVRQVLWAKRWLRNWFFFSPLSRLQFASRRSLERAAPNWSVASFVPSPLCLGNRWWETLWTLGLCWILERLKKREESCREEKKLKIL